MSPTPSRSPLAPRSTNEEIISGTPQFYKLLEPSSEDEIVPPPPPAFEDDAAPVVHEPAGAAAAPYRALTLYAIGHATFAYLYFSSSPFLSTCSWLFISALIINGIKVSTTGKVSTVAPLTQEQSARVIELINAAVDLFNRFKIGEPKLTFMAACGTWAFALASSLISPLTIAWIAYSISMRRSALPADATEKLDGMWFAASAKMASYATQKRREAVLAALAPRLEQLAELYERASGMIRVHSEGIKFLTPVVAFLSWAFLLGWTDKFLVGGMGLLGYKAWASPEAAAKFDAKIGKAARASRRMTLSAVDRIGLMKPKIN